MKNRFLAYAIISALLTTPMAASTFAAEEKPVKKTTKKVAKKAKPTPSKQTGATNEATLQSRLDEFALVTLTSINKNILPSLNKKEVLQNPNGSYTARYIEVDLKSLNTSYKKSSSTVVPYIGFMNYVEKEYHCTAASKEAALAGPFKLKLQNPLTELIKYEKGKWTY